MKVTIKTQQIEINADIVDFNNISSKESYQSVIKDIKDLIEKAADESIKIIKSYEN